MTLAQIDRLNLEGYANLDAWVAELDKRVELVLVERLRKVIETWCELMAANAEPVDSSNTTQSKPKVETHGEASLAIKPVTHEIRIRNQVIYLDPPVEKARADWYAQLQHWLGVVCCLKRIQSSRYEIGLKIRTATLQEGHYTTLVRFRSRFGFARR